MLFGCTRAWLGSPVSSRSPALNEHRVSPLCPKVSINKQTVASLDNWSWLSNGKIIRVDLLVHISPSSCHPGCERPVMEENWLWSPGNQLTIVAISGITIAMLKLFLDRNVHVFDIESISISIPVSVHLQFCWVPSGKRLHNYGKSPCYSWENLLFRLGHFQ